MYCGDETGSFIGEVGSNACRFGYGGEDNCKYVVPPYVVSSSSRNDDGGGNDRRIARSSSLHPPKYDEVMESILSMSSKVYQPVTDPNEFLHQGEIVDNWDNMEAAWKSGLTTLRATDTMKHTTGGNPYTFGKNSKYSTNNKRQKHSSGVASSTIVGENDGTDDGRCVHPILAITNGFSEYTNSGVAGDNDSLKTATGSQYNDAVKRQQYINYTELIMESLDGSSMFLAPAPMLAAFSLGRQSALMVDVGAGGCRVTPVVDGLVLKYSQRRNGRGGDWLGDMTWQALLSEKTNGNTKKDKGTMASPVVKPRYLLTKRSKGDSKESLLSSSMNSIFQRRAMNDLMHEIRTEPFVALHTMNNIQNIRIPFVSSCGKYHNDDEDGDGDSDDDDVDMSPPGTPSSTAFSLNNNNTGGGSDSVYHLPDGTPIDLSSSFGRDLCQLPELLFAETTTLPFQKQHQSINSVQSATSSSQASTLSNEPLHKLIQESLLSIGDVDARKELAGCICLVGGSSLLPNIEIRLSQELSALLPSFVKPKVIASKVATVERSCASWIGASILTSLGSFQQLWLSKVEYEEYGAAMAIQRFP